MAINPEELGIRFTYHAPSPEQVLTYEAIRAKGLEFAHFLEAHVPQSRELSLAITALEQAVMWGNAALARRS